MSVLSAAEERALAALSRLEEALRRLPAGSIDPTAALAHATHERACELLGGECDTLRRQLADLHARNHRLAAIADQVEGRLDGAITQLDELAGD